MIGSPLTEARSAENHLARHVAPAGFKTATVSMTREINRRLVLKLIRTREPISRAELSRRSRLQRSTVSIITEQLIAEGWITVGAVGRAPLGRKPTFLHLNADRARVLSIDVQPLETTVAISDLRMRFLAQETMPTGGDAAGFMPELCRRLRNLIAAHSSLPFAGIGVALPGRIDPVSGKLVFAPRLDWKGVDLRTPLEQATGLPVQLEHGANACALAELWSGRHPESLRNLLVISVSDGIDVGMVLNGQLVRGEGGLAGEFGHVILRDEGPRCRCGHRGCLEAYASNAAAVADFEALEFQRTGIRAGRLTEFRSLAGLAEQGNPSARRALDRMAQWLGKGIALLLTGLSPQVIVLQGEITRAWKTVGPLVTQSITRNLLPGVKPRIVLADPPPQCFLRGASALVLERFFGAPRIS